MSDTVYFVGQAFERFEQPVMVKSQVSKSKAISELQMLLDDEDYSTDNNFIQSLSDLHEFEYDERVDRTTVINKYINKIKNEEPFNVETEELVFAVGYSKFQAITTFLHISQDDIENDWN